MEIREKVEELLETIWIGTEEGKETSLPLDDLAVAEQEPVSQLAEAGYITLADGRLRLTDKGRPIARGVVRRHRLAERLLADVPCDEP